MWEGVSGYPPKSKGNRLDSLHLFSPDTFGMLISISRVSVELVARIFASNELTENKGLRGGALCNGSMETNSRYTRLMHSSMAVVGFRLYGEGSRPYGDGSSHII